MNFPNKKGSIINGFSINIQLFADPDKTEKATPRKRQKAREEGQVPISREFTSGLSFLAISFVFLLLGKGLLSSILNGTHEVFEIGERDLGAFEDFWIYLSQSFRDTFIYMSFIIFGAALFALIVGLIQTRFLFTLKPLKLDLSRLNPITGLKRMFSLRSLFELAKAIFKLVIVGVVGYSVVRGRFNDVLLTVNSNLIDGTLILWDVFSELIIKCAIALLVISVADYYYSRYEYEKNIMMTKHEVKEEFKEIEGNPEVKRRQRQIMMQYAMHRMMQEVPKASVVITNPTHFACALRYDPERDFAPILVAKGVDRVAQRIIEVAREYEIPIVRNPKLAREIYYSTELGEPIPERLYKAVAEVLAYVYSLRETRERL
ncbi:flagellar biosynthesis protein FlhB [Fervidobacterium thailandense]|uniref:Flagellar biosynthetic protein FlhB n=1 Tax=Fervidobacterium thailandense TaxID=1008305 RepID=A0A1E3G3E2_9BACT|nr:flagellar biosynthesis protein FlhB [Fervidobacterium thailandense]ODN30682.1 flagellar biosynthesis protein FlhB [Fervidobacterium thailandense]